MILLNPGPVNLSHRVRAALLGPDLCHREPELAELQTRVRSGLLEVYGSDPARFGSVLLAGSGTAAVEAMITSLVPHNGRLLTLENGVYGERMSAIAARQGIPGVRLTAGWGEPLPVDRLEALLVQHPETTHVAVVHHETTTGRLNPLEPVAEICRRSGVDLLIDAVSSFGGEALDLERLGAAACAGTSGKCLHAPPGLGFVLVDRALFARGCQPPRSVYLDLASHLAEQDLGSTAFTPPIPLLYALAEALAELAERGGWAARRRRYADLADWIGRELLDLGMVPYLEPGASSVVLRSYALPLGRTYEWLHDELRKRDFVIYAGQSALRKNLFRISTLGEIQNSDAERLIAAFREICARESGGEE